MPDMTDLLQWFNKVRLLLLVLIGGSVCRYGRYSKVSIRVD